MGSVEEDDWSEAYAQLREKGDEEYSVIGDKGEVGFLDFEEEKSIYNLDPNEEGPIIISHPFPFVNGKPQSVLVGETSIDCINIKNMTREPIELWSVKIYSSNPEDSFILSLMKPPSTDAGEEEIHKFVGLTALEDRVLQPGQNLTIWLSCRPREIGLHTTAIHFDAEETIERLVFLLADDNVSQALFSTKPYSRVPLKEKKFDCNQYVRGSRPSRSSRPGFRPRIPDYNIPQDIREMVESKQDPDVIMEGLSSRNYAKYFCTLIAMEEIHLQEEMRAHNMECVTMKRRGSQFLSLEVPGLAERRPSLVYGDCIFAQYATDGLENDAKPYQGYIHRVEADEIYLKFDKSFHQNHRDDHLYNVSFTYSRTNVRRQYHAVHAAEKLGNGLLFPSLSPHRRVIRRTTLRNPLNQKLNKEQARSVEKILGCSGFPPYVIYGPPGTGKTMTLVEAIMQLYTSFRKARILVCASSNNAADYMLEKLVGLGGTKIRENEILRLNAVSRPYEDVRPEFLKFCFLDEVMEFTCPPIKDLLQYKIIISTYMSASLLYLEGIRKGHFSHIFLDEAGQASEPETMVPISNLSMRDTVIVLAGDPMQLGPVIYSKSAENNGLGKSYMERLFDCDHYQRGDENYVTKLVRNYRCHPVILNLPSNLFYKGELIACKGENESFDYDWLPNSSFPVLFIGIQGCDEREGNNPSWFNRTEASKVVDTIKKLRNVTDLNETDIGVITPYRQQVLKLKIALESLEMPDVKVGTVENFQGQEREVIIISTVRSTYKHNEFDRIHNLGFLSNSRRFNVAVTRAKSLLIIIGNPHIISKDPHWDRLLQYCIQGSSYQGCPLPSPQNQDYADQPKVYNDHGELGEDVQWEQTGQYPYSNEGEWGEQDPQNFSGNVEYGEQAQLQKDGLDEDFPNQYSNEVQWEETAPGPSSNQGEWGKSDTQSRAEWGNAEENHHTNEAEWGEDTSSSSVPGLNDAEFPENKSSNIYNPYANGLKWGDITITPTGWDD